jgi:hypothetical protein
MNPTKNNIIRMLVAIIILLVLFAVKCGKDPMPPAKPVATIKAIQKTAAADSVAYVKKIRELQKKNDVLSDSLLLQKARLKPAQQTKQDGFTKLKEEVASDYDYSKLELLFKITALEYQSQEADRKCDTVIRTQDSIISNKDLQLAQKDTFITRQRLSFQDMSLVATAHEQDAKYQKRQAKKHKRGKGFWKVAAGVAVFVAASQSLK